jgi:hypothetical protein
LPEVLPLTWHLCSALAPCGRILLAWLPAAQEPSGAILLGHLSQQHPAELTPFLAQTHATDDITPAIVQACEVVGEGHA